MGWLWQDVRFGLRTILKDRGFFFTAVLALALGIGSTTAIFSVIDNVMLRPFPYTDAGHVFAIQIHDSTSGEPGGREWFSIPEFLDYQQKNRIFDPSLGVFEKTVLIDRSGPPEAFDADEVTGNAFDMLGVAPLLGRAITPSDAQPGAPPVFVLSYKVWQAKFGRDPGVVGKTFVMDHTPVTLIGVMPSRFAFWGADLWMPAHLDRSDAADRNRYFVLYGHLKPGLDPKSGGVGREGSCQRVVKDLPTGLSENVRCAFGIAGAHCDRWG